MITQISQIMKRIFYLVLFIFIAGVGVAQNDPYKKNIVAWQQNYMAKHEVVKGKDRKYFRFFPIDPTYFVSADFETVRDTVGFQMRTSAGTEQHFFKYGTLKFSVGGIACRLFVYQSEDLMKTPKYKDYLFVPFTDKTTGKESYASGRYLEFYSSDIQGNKFKLDFNGAYNPYCAYASGYHCPIPPKENSLPVAIRAGEMKFGKSH